MTYKVADLNNGPFGKEFDTLEEAKQEWATCIDEGIEANIHQGYMSREKAEASARAFYCIVQLEEDGAVMDEIWP